MATRISVDIDEAVEKRAAAALAAAGLTVSDAVRLTMQRLAEDRGFSATLRNAAGSTAPLEELEVVRLLVDANTEDGVLARGARGTIVHRYPRGEAFEVEFTRPIQAVVTLTPRDIERADD